MMMMRMNITLSPRRPEIMERAFEAFKDSAFDLFEEDDYEEEE